MKTIELNRRQFLKTTGGLIVSFNLFPSLPAFGQSTVGPGMDADPTQLDSWLAVAPDGTVTVFSGKVDLGTGVETALAQIVAEELDVSLARIRLAPADTSYSPDEGMTSGSQSITDGGVALRYASAEARDLLLQLAAKRLKVSLEQLTVSDGVIKARSGGSVTYWDIVTDDLLAREATAEIAPKPASQHTVIGTSAPRRDIPAKVSGAPSFVHDLDPPGMLHGRIARPPSYGAKLASLDEAGTKALLDANRKPSDADIRAALKGNLCRCGTHHRILRAVHRAAKEMK